MERLELSLFFLVPCSLLSLLVHERGALCEPGLLSCFVILLLCHRPHWDSNRGPAHVYTRVNIAAIIIAPPESDLADVTCNVRSVPAERYPRVPALTARVRTRTEKLFAVTDREAHRRDTKGNYTAQHEKGKQIHRRDHISLYNSIIL